VIECRLSFIAWPRQSSLPLAESTGELIRILEARFVAAIDAATQMIESTSQHGVMFLQRFRWVKTRRFPYVLYYAPIDGSSTPVVYAVAHSRRRLGYWLRREGKP